uniref:Uncharacterized protein n=1 Tax=Meloidogyne incognita TaxID=6306 RepID=A0A914NP47_MELIC
MVIDANKDAAKECVLRAKEAMKSNDMPRMQKLLRKAKQLDPSCDVSSILRNGQVLTIVLQIHNRMKKTTTTVILMTISTTRLMRQK